MISINTECMFSKTLIYCSLNDPGKWTGQLAFIMSKIQTFDKMLGLQRNILTIGLIEGKEK